jgi:uncharacterized protein YjbI with pentapeptide repeats
VAISAANDPITVAPDTTDGVPAPAPTRAIIDAARAGRIADLTKLPRTARSVPGAALRAICLDADKAGLDPSGVWVKGAIVTSALDLRSCEVSCPIRFVDSVFFGAVRFDEAKLRGLSFEGCTLRGLFGRCSVVEQGLSVRRSRLCGGIVLDEAQIGGDLDCSGSALSHPDACALSANLARIGGDARFCDGFSAEGRISLRHAQIAGDLDLNGATVSEPRGFALVATGASIGSRVRLSEGFAAMGGVDVSHTSIGSDLDCRGAAFDMNPHLRTAFAASGADIRGNLGLTQSRCGRIDLNAASIGGGLYCMGVRWGVLRGDVLVADNVVVRGSVDLSAASARGTIRLTGAKMGDLIAKGAQIGGALQRQLDASSLTPPVRHALAAGRTEISGNVALNQLQAVGEVRLTRARVGGDVDLSGCRLENEFGHAVVAAELVANRLSIWNTGLRGGINLAGAHVKTLDDDVGSWGTADHIVLSGFAYDGFGHTHVASSALDDLGRRTTRRRAVADWLKGRGLYRRLSWKLQQWPWTWRLHRPPATDPWDPRIRFAWLQRSEHFDAGDWQTLINTYRANGLEAYAVRAEVERENDRLRRAGLGRLRRLGRWVLRVTIGHGRRAWLVLVWAVPVVTLFAVAVSRNPETFTATSSAPEPTPPPVLYALDSFLPIIDFGLAGKWVAEGWMEPVQALVILLGWILSTLFVAGFTKIIRS